MNDEPIRRGNPNWVKKDKEVNLRETHEDDQAQAQLEATKVSTDRAFADGREMSDAEFQAALRFDGGINNVLPKCPTVPGYHVMWESAMDINAANLNNRLQNLGYTFVRVEECPDWRNHSARTAGIPGVVSYNEMVAVKIKEGRQHMIAKRLHHDMPLGREAAIKKKASEMMDYEGKRVGITMDEGTRELGVTPAKTPNFSV